MLFAVNIAVIALAQAASAETYDRGDMGLTVREIQTRLADWGYEPGAVDGVYGADTEAAVRRFQAANGLESDGRAGPATLAALGLPAGGVDNAYGDGSGELELLARLISAEARGEPYVGQVAVGAVVLNRVEHPSFPNSIAEVIFQPGAFSCMLDGQWDEPIAESAWGRRPRGPERLRPQRRRNILLQPRHRHKRLDLVAPRTPDNRQPPLLRLAGCAR